MHNGNINDPSDVGKFIMIHQLFDMGHYTLDLSPNIEDADVTVNEMTANSVFLSTSHHNIHQQLKKLTTPTKVPRDKVLPPKNNNEPKLDHKDLPQHTIPVYVMSELDNNEQICD